MATIQKGLRTGQYVDYWNGTIPTPTFKYRLPFFQYKWHSKKKTGRFVPYEPEKTMATYVSGKALSPFVCHLQESGIHQAMGGYPHFVAAWKPYHEKYLKPRMNADGVLDFTITPTGEALSKP